MTGAKTGVEAWHAGSPTGFWTLTGARQGQVLGVLLAIPGSRLAIFLRLFSSIVCKLNGVLRRRGDLAK